MFYGHRLVVEALEVGFRTEISNRLALAIFCKTSPCCFHIIHAFFLERWFLRTTMIARMTDSGLRSTRLQVMRDSVCKTLSNLLPVTATFASGQKSHQFGRGKLDKYIFAHMSANAHCNLLGNQIEIVMSNKS